MTDLDRLRRLRQLTLGRPLTKTAEEETLDRELIELIEECERIAGVKIDLPEGSTLADLDSALHGLASAVEHSRRLHPSAGVRRLRDTSGGPRQQEPDPCDRDTTERHNRA